MTVKHYYKQVLIECSSHSPHSHQCAERISSNITRVSFEYPIKVICPKVLELAAPCYLLSYGGGLVSGDWVQFTVDVIESAGLFLLTPAATKVFKRSLSEGGDGLMETRQVFQYRLKNNALLINLPEPVILFQNSGYYQEQNFHLPSHDTSDPCTASLISLDWFCAGRVSRGERWNMRRFKSVTRLFIGERLIYRDAFDLLGDDTAASISIASKFGLFNVFATILLVGPKCLPIIERINKYQKSRKEYSSETPTNQDGNQQLVSADLVAWSCSDIGGINGKPCGMVIRIAADEVWKCRRFISANILSTEFNALVTTNYFTRQV